MEGCCPVQHWGVDIRVNGECVLTIESNCLSGIDNIADYADTVRECAHHLLAFIGDGVAEPQDTMELDPTPNKPMVSASQIAADIKDLPF